MKGLRAVVSIATMAAHLAVVSGSRAGEGESSATAEALFRDGRAALARGDYTQAVAKFEESQRLEPAAGTLINLAGAEEKLGKLAAAWEHARAALDQLAPGDNRRPPARELFERLDLELPRLTLMARSPLPAGAEVERDGLLLGVASLGTPLPADPGPHRIVVKASGRTDASYAVELEVAARTTLEIEVGPKIVVQSRLGLSPIRTSGYVAVTAGIVGLGVAAVSGGLALDRKHTVSAECDPAGCGEAGLEAQNEGRTYATISTVSAVAGFAMIAGGIALLLLARGDVKAPVRAMSFAF